MGVVVVVVVVFLGGNAVVLQCMGAMTTAFRYLYSTSHFGGKISPVSHCVLFNCID